MAYIAPNSDVYLLQNVPLSKDYENTILFSTAAAQATYFISKCPGVSFSFTDTTFVRQLPGSISLEIPAESAMLCNYMMYRNTSYGNKWFYAFIDSVEYVSNSTSRINFTLDVIQTWHFDYQLTDVYLERNHTKTDVMGENLTPEPVDIGSYIDNEKTALLQDNYTVVIGTVDYDEGVPIDHRHAATIPLIGTVLPTSDDTDTQSLGHTYQKVYSGYTYTVFNASDVGAIDTFIGYYMKKGKIDAIKTMYIFPKEPFGQNPLTNGYVLPDNESIPGKVDYVAGVNTATTVLNGYLPKNKKLYTHPYNYMEVSNGSGQTLELKYELFNVPAFCYYSCKYNLQQPVSVIFEPMDYNITTVDPNNRAVNHDFQLMLQNFPMCSWAVDSYAAWQAQNSINMPGTVTGMVVGSMGDAFRSSLITGMTSLATGGVMGLINHVLAANKARKAPDQIRGSNSTGNGAVAQERQNFYVSRKSVLAQNAQRIDNYFTMFGYSIGDLYIKTANDDPRDHRPHYTYIKTIGSDIIGTLPAEDATQINSIYDKGIRWWKVPSEVGNYSIDNSPST